MWPVSLGYELSERSADCHEALRRKVCGPTQNVPVIEMLRCGDNMG